MTEKNCEFASSSVVQAAGRRPVVAHMPAFEFKVESPPACCAVTCAKPCSNTANAYPICCDGIYLPSFTFTNAARFQEDRLEPYTITFQPLTGSLLWETSVHGVYHQPMSFKHSPFDSFSLFVTSSLLILSFWGLTVWLPQTSATQTPQQNAG
jgi:hypothetical protein